jgi:hypothetical protein
MSRYNAHRDMIFMVAMVLDEELLPQVAFVGCCTMGLLITDAMIRKSVRYTKNISEN